jgi:hypothetical protein
VAVVYPPLGALRRLRPHQHLLAVSLKCT